GTGDGDFHEAIRTLQLQGKHVILWATRRAVNGAYGGSLRGPDRIQIEWLEDLVFGGDPPWPRSDPRSPDPPALSAGTGARREQPAEPPGIRGVRDPPDAESAAFQPGRQVGAGVRRDPVVVLHAHVGNPLERGGVGAHEDVVL